MTPERALTAFWLACTEDGDMDGVALKAAMLKFASPAAQQERKPMTPEQAIDLCVSGGIQDCLQDPFDIYGDGNNLGSIQSDMVRLIRKAEAFHGIKETP